MYCNTRTACNIAIFENDKSGSRLLCGLSNAERTIRPQLAAICSHAVPLRTLSTAPPKTCLASANACGLSPSFEAGHGLTPSSGRSRWDRIGQLPRCRSCVRFGYRRLCVHIPPSPSEPQKLARAAPAGRRGGHTGESASPGDSKIRLVTLAAVLLWRQSRTAS